MHLRLFSCVLALACVSTPATGRAQQPTLNDKTAAPAAAQSPGQTAAPADGKTPTLSLTANLVNLPVVVRDKKGALVTNLTKSDFTLSVDGHAQTIRYFDRDQNLPLTLGLLVDTSQSQRTVLDEEQTASSAFIDNMLTAPADRPADRAFIVQFAREVELLQDLTSSRPKLQAAIKEIGTPNPHENNSSDDDNNSNANSGSSGNGSNHHHGGTTLYDAVYLSANELLHKEQGRKAIIILSDGVDRNSKETLNSAIEAAQRADTIIYAIYFKGEEPYNNQGNRGGGRFPGGGGGYPGGGYPGGGYPGGGYPGGGGGYPGGRNGGSRGGGQPTENRVDGKKILQRMSDETGGRLFEGKKGKISDTYNEIAEELRSQYRLGFTPDATITGDGYHQVDLRIPNQKNLKIQTRDGYYTGK
jgi:VWFA-related protein